MDEIDAGILKEIKEAASKWPRCCDQWQDGLGGIHCQACSQKTFAMLGAIQRILGIGKDGKTDDEKRRYLRDLGDELAEIERNQSHSYDNPEYHDFMNDRY